MTSPSIRKLFTFDSRSLAVYRICLALLVLFDLVTRFPGLKAFYTDAGVLPRSFLFSFLVVDFRISAFFLSGTAEVTALLFLFTAVSAVTLLMGRYTRLSTLVVWFLLMSLHVRNPMLNTNGDHMLRLILFWSLWMPTQRNKVFYSPGHIFYFLQIAFIYWFAAAHKMLDPLWFKGDGLFISLKDIDIGTGLAHSLAMFPGVVKVANYGSILFEAVAPFLLLLSGRVRGITVGLFILFHICVSLCFQIGFFPLVSIVAFIPFLPSGFWDSISARLSKGILPLPSEPGVCRMPLIAVCLGAYFILFVFFSNLQSLNPSIRLPLFPKIVKILYLDQTWKVFTPPATYSIRQEISGRLKNGETIYFTGDPAEESIFRTWHGKRYLFKTWPKRFNPTRRYVVSYLCKEWNHEHHGEERLEQIEIAAVYQYFHPEHEAPQKAHRFSAACAVTDAV